MEEYNGILLKCDSSKEFVDLDEMGSFFTDIAGLYEDIVVFESFLRNRPFPVETLFSDFIEKGRWPKLSDEYRLKVYKIESNSPPILYLFSTLQNILTVMQLFEYTLRLVKARKQSKLSEEDTKRAIEEEIRKKLYEEGYYPYRRLEENYAKGRIIRRVMKLKRHHLYVVEVKEITLPPKNRDNDKRDNDKPSR